MYRRALPALAALVCCWAQAVAAQQVLPAPLQGGAPSEVPVAVQILRWEEEGGLVRIYASILVDRESQKKIVIGHGGQKIKEIGTAARLDLEQFLGRKVYLDLRVRDEPGWREQPRLLAELERDVYAGGEAEARNDDEPVV